MITLGSIAHVRMGTTLRGRDATRPDPKGSLCILRISDLSDDGELISTNFTRFEPKEAVREDSMLRPGDVLLPNRGKRSAAHVWMADMPKTIAGAQFFVIQPDISRIQPDYLAWYLRTESAAQQLHAHRKGTLVHTLQIPDLQKLELPLPCIEQQSKIISIDALAVLERKLSERQTQYKFNYVQCLLCDAASQSK